MGKRGPKKGYKKNKVDKDIVKIVSNTEDTPTEESTKKKAEPAEIPNTPDGISLSMNDREAIYERAAQAEDEREDPLDKVLSEEETEAAPEEAVEEETPAETVPEETETETSTETEGAEYVAEPQQEEGVTKESEEEQVTTKEDIKTVPLAALHESRAKEKKAREEAEELRRNLAEAKRSQPSEYTTEETEEESETADLRRRLDAMEAKERDRDRELQRLDLENNVSIVHKNLLAKGIDGFDTIGRHIIDSTLRKAYIEDPDYAMAHDTPEGWEKIYLEALPSLQKIGREQHKTETFTKKKEAKKDAQLITTSGKKPAENAKPKKKLTPMEEYIQERNAQRL